MVTENGHVFALLEGNPGFPHNILFQFMAFCKEIYIPEEFSANINLINTRQFPSY